MSLAKRNFAGFYRKNPFLANITSVAYECWHLAIMGSFALIRAVKLVVVIILYLGRLDRPILADGIGDFGLVVMDYYPIIFKQDLLSLEAHRHPYIERLGMMYLMKLKHGKKFANRAGSHWRLLFVFALMPHLRKNRILAHVSNDPIDGGSERDESDSLPLRQPMDRDAEHDLSLQEDSVPSDEQIEVTYNKSDF